MLVREYGKTTAGSQQDNRARNPAFACRVGSCMYLTPNLVRGCVHLGSAVGYVESPG